MKKDKSKKGEVFKIFIDPKAKSVKKEKERILKEICGVALERVLWKMVHAKEQGKLKELLDNPES